MGTPSLIKLYFKNYSDLEFYLCKYAVYLFAIHLNEKKVSKREVLYQTVPSLNFVKINLCTYDFVFVKILSSISPKVSLQFTQWKIELTHWVYYNEGLKKYKQNILKFTFYFLNKMWN